MGLSNSCHLFNIPFWPPCSSFILLVVFLPFVRIILSNENITYCERVKWLELWNSSCRALGVESLHIASPEKGNVALRLQPKGYIKTHNAFYVARRVQVVFFSFWDKPRRTLLSLTLARRCDRRHMHFWGNISLFWQQKLPCFEFLDLLFRAS